MKKLILILLGINDWKPVWSDMAEWVNDEGESTGYVFSIIFYSKIRNKYKLECIGYEPKALSWYGVALKKLIELSNNDYLGDKNIEFINSGK